jgi:hypothetical protein
MNPVLPARALLARDSRSPFSISGCRRPAGRTRATTRGLSAAESPRRSQVIHNWNARHLATNPAALTMSPLAPPGASLLHTLRVSGSTFAPWSKQAAIQATDKTTAGLNAPATVRWLALSRGFYHASVSAASRVTAGATLTDVPNSRRSARSLASNAMPSSNRCFRLAGRPPRATKTLSSISSVSGCAARMATPMR